MLKYRSHCVYFYVDDFKHVLKLFDAKKIRNHIYFYYILKNNKIEIFFINQWKTIYPSKCSIVLIAKKLLKEKGNIKI